MYIVKKENEKLIKIDPDSHELGSWINYAEGYKSAAIKLLEESFKTDDNDFYNRNIIYPIFFLYRHMIELLLKENLMINDRLKNTEIRIRDKHKLRNLWIELKPFVEDYLIKNKEKYKGVYDVNITTESLNELENNILEINTIDESSFSFRYPIDKNGKSSINDEIYHSLGDLKSKIQKTFGYLKAISIWILIITGNKNSENNIIKT